MDFKRHHQQQGFAAFNSRLNNPGNGGHGGYQHQGGFVNHHVPHNSRQYKPSEGHSHNAPNGVNVRGLSLVRFVFCITRNELSHDLKRKNIGDD